MTHLLDELAIRGTLARYNLSGDRGRFEELANAFTPGGILDAGDWRAEGRGDIVNSLRLLSGRCSPRLTLVRHHLTTCEVTMDGSGWASSRAYFLVLTNVGPDHSGTYVDRFVSHEGEWLIAHRRARLDWISPKSLFGLRRQ